MSRQAREIANLHGRSLPMFRSQQEAEEALFTRRDKHLALLSKAAESYPAFEADFGPESLKTLERWYFVLYEAGAFHRIGVGRDTFETCMAMYFGETAVRDAAARWIVEEYFLARGRYEIGVQRGSVKLMLDRLTDLYAEPNNKRRQSLYRRYMKYFSASRE